MAWSIIVHGGAGHISNALAQRHEQGCGAAVAVGAAILEAGGTAMDAVCRTVRALENDDAFNAGRGSALDEDGLPTLDAALCRGSDLAYGAVAAVLGVVHPIDLARAVLEDGRHCLLAGPAALRFARTQGVELAHPAVHETERALKEWARRRAEGRGDMTADWKPTTEGPAQGGGTVGAVALDEYGELVAGTSTGGLHMKTAGRVGDSPIAGQGTYADAQLGAMSATGHGETMMRTVFTFRALMAMNGRQDLAASLQESLQSATSVVGGKGGAIAVLPDGRIVHQRNTRGMGVAYQRKGEPLRTAFEND